MFYVSLVKVPGVVCGILEKLENQILIFENIFDLKRIIKILLSYFTPRVLNEFLQKSLAHSIPLFGQL